MNFTDKIISIIPSRDIRRYYALKPPKWNDEQMGTVIHNFAPYTECIALYEELLKSTDNNTLKAFIEKTLRVLKKDGHRNEAIETEYRNLPIYSKCDVPLLFCFGSIIQYTEYDYKSGRTNLCYGCIYKVPHKNGNSFFDEFYQVVPIPDLPITAQSIVIKEVSAFEVESIQYENIPDVENFKTRCSELLLYMRNSLEETKHLEFSVIYYLLPHSERFPVKVVSLGNEKLSVVKIPDYYTKRNGHTVPIIEFAETLFVGKKSLTDIILPQWLESIPKGAFAGCCNLKRINIPIGIHTIFEGTFQGCYNLQDVYFEGTEEEWHEVNIVYEGHRVINDKNLGLFCKVETYEIPGNEPLLNAHIHFNCASKKHNDGRFTIEHKGKVINNILKSEEI